MKLLGALSILVFSLSAAATSIQTMQVFELSKVEKDNKPTKYSATITVNYFKKTVAIEIVNNPCMGHPQGARCRAMSYPVFDVTVPLKDRTLSCGSVIYTASKDSRPVDGALVTLTLTDNTHRKCRDLVLSDLVGELEVRTLRSNSSTHYLMTK